MKKYVEKLIAKADMQMIVPTLLKNGPVHQVRFFEPAKETLARRADFGTETHSSDYALKWQWYLE